MKGSRPLYPVERYVTIGEEKVLFNDGSHILCTPKDIFGEWVVLNSVSDVAVVDCVYSDGGADNKGSLTAEHSAGSYFTLSLTVSPEFSAYAESEDSELLMESLRQTFYDYIHFDEFN